MSNGTWTKVLAKKATEVSKQAGLGDEAKKLLRDDQSPEQFLDVLTGKQQFADAVRFLANALPKREAIWWACQCARGEDGAPPPKVAAALEAAEKWVVDPSEENRRPTKDASDAAELGTPAGCAAMGAFMSGGSLAPPNLPVVPPAEHLTAHFVAGGVTLAAVLKEPAKASEKFKRFLALGVDVAQGKNRWKEAAPKK